MLRGPVVVEEGAQRLVGALVVQQRDEGVGAPDDDDRAEGGRLPRLDLGGEGIELLESPSGVSADGGDASTQLTPDGAVVEQPLGLTDVDQEPARPVGVVVHPQVELDLAQRHDGLGDAAGWPRCAARDRRPW